MTKTKIALFAIPTCAILIAIGVFSVNFAETGLESNSDNSYSIQNEIIPQAYAAKPTFVVLDADDMGLTPNEFMQEVECKIKLAEPFEDSQVMWCYFTGDVSIEAAIFAIAQIPPQDILGFTGNVIQANSVADSFIAFIIMEALNAEIEANTGLDLSNPNGFEAELSTVCENLDQEDPTCEISWKVKDMWS